MLAIVEIVRRVVKLFKNLYLSRQKYDINEHRQVLRKLEFLLELYIISYKPSLLSAKFYTLHVSYSSMPIFRLITFVHVLLPL